MKDKTKHALILTLPVAGMIAIAALIYWLLIVRKQGQAIGLLPSEIAAADLLWCALALICALGVVYIFYKLLPMKYMYDPNVRLLADSYSMKFLTVYFIPNAFYEELIFRGALQPIIGVIPSTLIFTLVHISYYKKPLMLVEVFLQGLILAFLYHLSGSLWITTLAHTAFNTIQTYLIKSNKIPYFDPMTP